MSPTRLAVASAVGTTLEWYDFTIHNSDFLRWGWRLPPLTSVVIVGVGLWIRRGIDETPMFERLTGSKAARPIGEVVRRHWRRLLIAGGVRIGSDVFYSLVFVFTLTYVTSVLKLSRTLALATIAIATPFNAIVTALFVTCLALFLARETATASLLD